MKLSDSERQSLARMERCIALGDPGFAARMAWPDDSRHRGRLTPVRHRAVRRFWRALSLCLMVVVAPLAVTLLTLGSIGFGVWAVVLGSALVLLDAGAATRWWLSLRRYRDWVEGS